MNVRYMYGSIIITVMYVVSVSALYIDFTDSYYQNFINGQTCASFMVKNSDLAITVAGYKNNGTMESPVWNPAELTWNEESNGGDGIGILDDEINGGNLGNNQKILIQFPEIVKIDEIHILDLFYEKNNAKVTNDPDETTDGAYLEVGYYTTDGIISHEFKAENTEQSQQWGEKFVDAGNIHTDWIEFWAEDQQEEGDNDFALGGMKVESVPQPATLSLCFLGIIALVGFSRIYQKRNNI